MFCYCIWLFHITIIYFDTKMGNVCCQQSVQSNVNIKSGHIFNFQPTEAPPIKNVSVLRRIQQFQKKLDSQNLEGVILKSPMLDKNKLFVYEGEWLGQLPHGYGKIYFQAGQYFQGQLRNGSAEGNGRYIFINGDYYEGNVSKNTANGNGKFISNSVTFQGQWKDSKPFLGCYLFSNGLKVQLLKENQGIITWPDHKIYKGAIKDLNPHGKGQLKFKNGNTYQGQWNKGLMHGYGQFKWADGSSYKGNYVNGVKQGEGKYLYKDQNKYYEGQWKSGKMNGSGKVIHFEKIIETGIYENGKLIKKEQSQMKIKERLETTQNQQ